LKLVIFIVQDKTISQHRDRLLLPPGVSTLNYCKNQGLQTVRFRRWADPGYQYPWRYPCTESRRQWAWV